MKGKEYVRPISSTWWLQRPSWKRFMLRELTALFVGAYAVLLLLMVYSARDEQSFAAFYEWLRSPLSLLFHLVALAMVLYHACTWFQLTPQAMPLWRGEDRVNAQTVINSQYVVWAVVSVVIAGLAIGLGR
jgi:succinate dehydrogenase subunit C